MAIKSTDTLEYKRNAFNNIKYHDTQRDKILERIDKFKEGRLYLEIGGKFLYDPHAARVLPGFNPRVKADIFVSLKSLIEIIFCINAEDLRTNRQLKSSSQPYTESVLEMLKEVEEKIGIKPQVSINLCDRQMKDKAYEFEDKLDSLGYKTAKRFKIDGYPNDTDNILSDDGYGFDEYIETNKNLVLVIGAASNSGKMSTCLGQIYHDTQRGQNSGYAKYETFPIWTLPLNHPINLAYEAATADIGDYNVIDTYHELAYGKRSVNYNRDVAAFEIVMSIAKDIVADDSYMNEYKSPTDMGINYAGFAIENDQVACIAGLGEIRRRAEWYNEQVERGEGDFQWVRKCKNLENQALRYIRDQGYNPDLEI